MQAQVIKSLAAWLNYLSSPSAFPEVWQGRSSPLIECLAFLMTSPNPEAIEDPPEITH